MAARRNPFTFARRAGSRPTTRGNLFGIACDCADCGIVGSLDRQLSLGGRAHDRPAHDRPTSVAPQALQCGPSADGPEGTAGPSSMPPAKLANKRLCKELDDLEAEKPAACTVALFAESNLFRWRATVDGPPGTPYEGGRFVLDIRFPLDYPFKPPRVSFATKVYHPNIDHTGACCLDVLDSDWCPALTVANVLNCIIGLLADPCPEEQRFPLLPDVAEIYRQDRLRFATIAADWTRLHAAPG